MKEQITREIVNPRQEEFDECVFWIANSREAFGPDRWVALCEANGEIEVMQYDTETQSDFVDRARSHFVAS